jgi:hypothetical protein
MNKSKKIQNPWQMKSDKKKVIHPNIHVSSKRSLGNLKGGFDRALIRLGVVIVEKELDPMP